MRVKIIKNKLIFILTIAIIVSLSPFILFSQEMKPDLIISSVTSRTEFKSSVTYYSNQPAMPLRYRVIIYTLTITNIGRVPFNESFCIAYTNKDYSYNDINYSNVSLVNTPPKEIPVGGNIEVHIERMLIGRNETSTRFLIQTDGEDHGNQQMPKIEELNYDNNTFTF